MIERILNFLKLYRILRERGNWPLIRRSRHQLTEFMLCRGSLNQKNIVSAFIYWWGLLKGLDLLVWRLETFGFLYLPQLPESEKNQLNRHLT